ncbi:MAG: glycosyltransferase [Candidatus Pacebacteria bacterium]|nr:glycosyltransferase [Candidatus Paceibacterota bacterium]
MKIAFFTDNFYPEISGITDTLLITGQELVNRGHSVAFVCPRYAESDYKKAKLSREKDNPRLKDFTIHHMPSVVFPGSATGQSRIAIPIGSTLPFIKRFKPDIIHTNMPFGAGIDALICAKSFGIPFVGTNHTPIEEFMAYGPVHGPTALRSAQKYFAWYYNRCQFITAPSAGLLVNMRKFGLKIPSHALANPVLLNNFSVPTVNEKESLKKELNLAQDVVLYAGRLSPEKHIDVILRAVKKLRETLPEIILVITGHGSAEKDLKNLAKELGVEKNVRFTGFVDIGELAKYYKAADVFSIMSTADTQSIALMQAYACGLSAVGASSNGLKEYLKSECSFQVEPGDVEALAEKLGFLLKDKNMAEEMGKAAVKYVSELSPSKIGDEWERIFQEGIKKYHAGRKYKPAN